MIDNLLTNPDQLGRLLVTAIVIIFFLYIIILSFLQVRQIRILQEKVQTDADNLILIVNYAYLLVQIILFIVVLLFIS